MSGDVQLKGIQYVAFSFSCHFSRTLCSLSVPGIQEQVELHTVLRTEIMGKGSCLDSFQWLSSATLYVLDYPFCCNWWNFILCNGWVIILLKIHKHAVLLIKYPCSTRDLDPLHPSFYAHSLQSMEACSLSCLGFKDLLERMPCAVMSGTSPMHGLYWFST